MPHSLGTENLTGLEDVGFKKAYALFCAGIAHFIANTNSINMLQSKFVPVFPGL